MIHYLCYHINHCESLSQLTFSPIDNRSSAISVKKMNVRFPQNIEKHHKEHYKLILSSLNITELLVAI